MPQDWLIVLVSHSKSKNCGSAKIWVGNFPETCIRFENYDNYFADLLEINKLIDYPFLG